MVKEALTRAGVDQKDAGHVVNIEPSDMYFSCVAAVKELFAERRRVVLFTVCTVKGKVVIDGDALVMPTSREARSAISDQRTVPQPKLEGEIPWQQRSSPQWTCPKPLAI